MFLFWNDSPERGGLGMIRSCRDYRPNFILMYFTNTYHRLHLLKNSWGICIFTITYAQLQHSPFYLFFSPN